MKNRNGRMLGQSSLRMTLLLLLAGTVLSGMGASGLFAADLSQKTVKAFNEYVKAAEVRMKREESHKSDFLYIETLPKAQYNTVMSTLLHGGVYVQQLHTLNAKGQRINVPGGLINHWVGDVYIPGESIATALDVLRDYNNFKNIYKPEVVRSHLVSREDSDDYNVFLRLQKKSIVTVTLDTWYSIRFKQLGPNRGYSRSISTRIQQVEDAGTPHEHLDPVGHDSGYLWRINSYWRYEQVDHGIIIEWESIALSRPIPFLISWFVKPLVRSIARATVQDMLTSTRKAIVSEKPQPAKAKSDTRPAALADHPAAAVSH